MSGSRAERDAAVAPQYAADRPLARPGATSPSLLRIEWLARLLDRAVGIPGTRVGFGLDPLLGLVPGFGDVATGALSLWIILEAARLGAPRATLVRMLGNVAVDTLGGTVPLVGDLFDVLFRSNTRNLRLIKRWIDQKHPESRAIEGVVTSRREL